jgi:hypothetical protein
MFRLTEIFISKNDELLQRVSPRTHVVILKMGIKSFTTLIQIVSTIFSFLI